MKTCGCQLWPPGPDFMFLGPAFLANVRSDDISKAESTLVSFVTHANGLAVTLEVFGTTFLGVRVLNGPQYSARTLNGAPNIMKLLNLQTIEPPVSNSRESTVPITFLPEIVFLQTRVDRFWTGYLSIALVWVCID